MGLIVLATILMGCRTTYPADTPKIKYGNRQSAGSRLDFNGKLLVPDKMNILYFYADW